MVDLDAETGPLFVSPGSHKLSRIGAGEGRVRRVRRAGADTMAPLVDARLRRGDLLLMNMFTRHAGGANRSRHNRLGVYNKYRAHGAPPGCGPIVFSDAAHRAVVCRGRPLLPHHGERPVTALRASDAAWLAGPTREWLLALQGGAADHLVSYQWALGLAGIITVAPVFLLLLVKTGEVDRARAADATP